MKKLIALLLLAAVVSASGIYIAQVSYKNEKFTAGSVYVMGGDIGLLQEPAKGYTVKILSSEGDNLFIRKFKPPLIKVGDTFGEGTGVPIVELNETTFSLTLPYKDDGDKIVVLDENKKQVLEFDVARFKKQKLAPSYKSGSGDLTLIISGAGVLALLLGGVIIYLRNRPKATGGEEYV
jgi:hypothetical protein